MSDDAPKLDERQRELFYELLEEESATIADLARNLGWPVPRAKRVMESLETLGLVDFDEAGDSELITGLAVYQRGERVYHVDREARRRHDLGMKFG